MSKEGKGHVETIGYNQTSYNVMKNETGNSFDGNTQRYLKLPKQYDCS